jgi:hypothetical protein
MENPILKCPVCDSKLEITHKDHYQDIQDHVSQPNKLPSLKDGYQCLTLSCIAHQCDVRWIADGECFYGDRPENISYSELSSKLKAKHGTSMAVNSWNWHYQLGLDAIKAKSFKIDLGKYVFKFEPKQKGGDKYDIDKQYQPNLWCWKTEIWKKEENSYINVIPFWRMAKFSINKFKDEYKQWKLDGNSKSLEACYQEATCLTCWNTTDDRFYAKFTKIWLTIFHPQKVKEVMNVFNNK